MAGGVEESRHNGSKQLGNVLRKQGCDRVFGSSTNRPKAKTHDKHQDAEHLGFLFGRYPLLPGQGVSGCGGCLNLVMLILISG